MNTPAPPTPDPAGAAAPVRHPPRSSRLWLWVLIAFGLQAAVWTAWLITASHHKVAEVPLESRPGR